MEDERMKPDAILDEAIDAVRNDAPRGRIVEEARQRVWEIVRQEAVAADAEFRNPRVQGCAGFRQDIPAYIAGRLTPARVMLLEDHTHECVDCRKALHAARFAPADVPKPIPIRRTVPAFRRYASAAALLAGIVISSWYIYDQFGPGPSGPRAVLAASEGPVYKLSGDSLRPLAAGASLDERDVLRTGNGGHAMVRLRDGSMVEVGDRAAFSVSAKRNDTTINLDYGRIIVSAAKQRNGHLYVASNDCRVSVTGTVFSVNRGTKGSRVSVIEGTVRVQQGNKDAVLLAGQQTTTDSSMGPIPVRDEIAWSRNLTEYLALLREFSALDAKLQTVQMPGLRYQSRFLDSAPAGTTIYISLPNLNQALADTERLLDEQVRDSDVLRQWMEQRGSGLKQFLDRAQRLNAYLGEEVVLAFQPCKGFCGVLIANTVRPGLREFLQSEIAKARPEQPGPKLRIVEGSTVPADGQGEILAVLNGDRLVIGERPELVQAAMNGGTGFSNTAFGQRISEVFRRGTGIVVAADVQRMIGQGQQRPPGIDAMPYLIAEQKTAGTDTEYSAVVNFNSARTGIASWLGAPAPMAGLKFISSEAQLVAAAVTKKPADMLEDLLRISQNRQPNGSSPLTQAEQFLGVDLRNEIAGAIGGEVTFAIDGPVLPVPSWKLIVEVDQPAVLQAGIEKMIAAVNGRLRQLGRPEIRFDRQQEGSQTWYTMHFGAGTTTLEANYVYFDGYLVAAANRGLLKSALQMKQSGNSIAASAKFRNLLPSDGHANFSAVLYQDAGSVLDMIASGSAGLEGIRPEQRAAAQAAAQNLRTSLICAYGEPDRIEIASKAGLLNMAMNTMIGPLLVRSSPNPGTTPRLRAYR